MRQSNPPSGIDDHVRRRVRVILAERDMGLRDLAKALGWTRSTTSRRLGRGERTQPLTAGQIEEIAQALDVPLASLLPAEAAA